MTARMRRMIMGVAVLAFALPGITTAFQAVFGASRCTRVDAQRIQVKGLAMAVENYAIDTGHLPAQLDELLESSEWVGTGRTRGPESCPTPGARRCATESAW